MTPLRPVLVLAILTALLGAPSVTFAASNELSAAQASPAAGSTSTTFTLRVTYAGRFPATAVTATVAGRTLAMRLISGSAENGTWSVSTTLPPGSWPVVFSAAVERGPAPSLPGPTVDVAAPATLLPAPRTTVAPPSPPMDRPAEADPEPAPVATPPPHEPAPASPSSSIPADDPQAGPIHSTSVTSAGGEHSASAAPTVGAGPASEWTRDTANGAPASPAAPHSSAGRAAPVAPDDGESGAGRSHVGDDGGVPTILVVVLSGVAAVALLGTAVLMAARRRSESDEPAAATGEATDQIVDAIVERRTLRRARVRMTDDPIIASMGLRATAERRPRRRARQIGGGPGEREMPPTPD